MPVVHAPGQLFQVGRRLLWAEQEGEGEPVLLLAGLGPAGSHLIFHPHFRALATSHRVIYLDLFGRGRSDRPDDLHEITFDSDVDDVAGFIATLNLGPVHIYGFSYGGLIAQALALRCADLVATVTLANTLHSPEMWQRNHENINHEIERQFPEVWDRIQEKRREGFRSTDPEIAGEYSVHSRLVRFYNPENAGRILVEPEARNADLYPIFCGADVDFMVGGQISSIPDFRPLLKEIAAPLQVLAGRYDRALYPLLQREFAIHAPACSFHMLERSGSFSHIEEPEAVISLLREFLHAHRIGATPG